MQYLNKIERMFGEGGRFSRALTSRKYAKQGLQTEEGYACGSEKDIGRAGNILQMKKSATEYLGEDRSIKSQERKLFETINFQGNQEREVREEIKAIKIEDIGERINKVREYVKRLTGISPRNKTDFRHMVVKIDKECQNKIME